MSERATERGVRAGDRLPPLEIEITRTLIVAGALASRDYQDVHHDPVLAREKGAPDIFMNILTTNGLVGRYLTDHFGPAAVLRKVAIRLGAPNYPGDTMVLTGRVEEVAGTAVVVRVTGENGIGRHVTGTATLTLPQHPVSPKHPVSPQHPVSPEPTASPRHPVSPEPTASPQHPVSPEPTASPQHPVSPKPTASPEPTVSPEPAA